MVGDLIHSSQHNSTWTSKIMGYKWRNGLMANTYHEYKFQIVCKGPPYGVSILFILVFTISSFNQRISYQVVDRRGIGPSKSCRCWREGPRPEDHTTYDDTSAMRTEMFRVYLRIYTFMRNCKVVQHFDAGGWREMCCFVRDTAQQGLISRVSR